MEISKSRLYLMKNLLRAISNSDVKRVNRIVSKYPNLLDSKVSKCLHLPSPLWKAVIYRHHDIVRVLIDSGADPNEKYSKLPKIFFCNPLHYLVESENFTLKNRKLAEYLIRRGTNVNSHRDDRYSDFSVLWHAVFCGNLEWTEFLLKNGAALLKLDASGGVTDACPVYASFRENHPNTKEMLMLLMKYGLEPASLRNKEKESNLLFSFIRFSELYYKNNIAEMLDIVKFILDSGIPVNVPNLFKNEHIDYYPPLNYAIKSGIVEMVKLLIDKGADVNQKSANYGISPIYVAVEYAQNDLILDTLVAAGADMHARSTRGWSVLHHACLYRNQFAIDYLIKNGVDIFHPNFFGKIPFDYTFEDTTNFYTDDECGLFVVREIAKMCFQKVSVPRNIDLMGNIEKNPRALEHFDNFTKAFTKMSSNKLRGIYSYYEIANMAISVEKLANFMKTEEIKEEFENFKNSLTSPYGDSLRQVYDKAILLRDESVEIQDRLKYVFHSSFPDVILRKIATFLRVQDLPLQ